MLTKPIVVGDNAFIDEEIMILPAAHIGNNVVIGERSVVTKDILDNSVAGGVPARVIKLLMNICNNLCEVPPSRSFKGQRERKSINIKRLLWIQELGEMIIWKEEE